MSKDRYMKTYTICGSMKYLKEMKEISWNLETIDGIVVIQCVYNENKKTTSKESINNLKEAHYKKIDISDGIYVVDIDGYIGEATKGEIAYAIKRGKDIIYHSQYNQLMTQ